VASSSPERTAPTITVPDSPSSVAPALRPKSAPRSWHELGQESPEKPFWGARQADGLGGSTDLTGAPCRRPSARRPTPLTRGRVARWLTPRWCAPRLSAAALANASTLPGSSQIWRLDGASDGAGGWGDVGVPTAAWDDGQQRDELSSNDDDDSSNSSSGSSSSSGGDSDSSSDDDDFAGVPYVPIGDGSAGAGLPPSAYSAPEFYPSGYGR
jgi:hypothetical protein